MKKCIFKSFAYCLVVSMLLSIINTTVLAQNPNYFETLTIAGDSSITLPNGKQYPIVADEARPNDALSYVTSTSLTKKTNPFDAQNTAEVIIVNNVVVGIGEPAKGTYVPHNGMVVSGSGTMKNAVASLKFGDVVSTKSVILPAIEDNIVIYKDATGNIVKQPITGVNRNRGAGDTILYTPEYGESTKTNRWGTEITVVNNIITAIGRQGTNGDKGAPIPKDGCVISINGKPERYNHLKVGDEFIVQLKLPKYYSADVVIYNAYNPKVKEDNPDGWDHANNKPYGGFRGTNQLIVYDKDYGQPTTGTNVWGQEITVDFETNKAVSAKNGNSPILNGQYVLSGHGTKAEILRNLDIANVLVILNKQTKQITFITTPDMMIDTLNYKVEKALVACNDAKTSLLDVDYTKLNNTIDELSSQKAKITGLQSYIDSFDFNSLYTEASKITKIIDDSYYSTIETLKIEKRAVWYRPTETNEAAVRKTLQEMKNSGMNAIYLEAWIGGYPIWNSDVIDSPILPSLNGFDALEAFTRIAKELDIEVHAWVKSFFIGGFTNAPNSDTIGAQHPEWLLKSRDGGNSLYVAEYNSNFYFMNPLEPAARDLVSDLYKEIVTKYDVQGVHFDYVRFPEADGNCENGMLNDFGYNQNIVDAYKAKYTTDPFTIDKNHPEWEQWCHFRADIINTFVYRTATELKSMNRNIKLSAAVVPDYDVAPLTKYQETLDWVHKGYIDEIFTMSYYHAFEPVATDAQISKNRLNDMAYSSTGITSQMNLPYSMILKQLQVIREQNTASSAVFTLKELIDSGMHMKLREHMYRDDAIALPEDVKESVPAILNEVLRKINTIYTVYGNDSIHAYPVINIKVLLSLLSNSTFSEVETKVHIHLIDNLIATVNRAKINVNAKDRITTDLNRAKYLLTVHYNREKAMNDQVIDNIYLEVSKDSVLGNKTTFRLRAEMDFDGYKSVLYLNPDQFTITSHSDNVSFIDNKEVVFKDNEKVCITIKLNDSYQLRSNNLFKFYKMNTSFSEAKS